MTPIQPVDGPETPDGEPMSGATLKAALVEVIGAASSFADTLPMGPRGALIAAIDQASQFASWFEEDETQPIARFQAIDNPAEHLVAKELASSYLTNPVGKKTPVLEFRGTVVDIGRRVHIADDQVARVIVEAPSLGPLEEAVRVLRATVGG